MHGTSYSNGRCGWPLIDTKTMVEQKRYLHFLGILVEFCKELQENVNLLHYALSPAWNTTLTGNLKVTAGYTTVKLAHLSFLGWLNFVVLQPCEILVYQIFSVKVLDTVQHWL